MNIYSQKLQQIQLKRQWIRHSANAKYGISHSGAFSSVLSVPFFFVY